MKVVQHLIDLDRRLVRPGTAHRLALVRTGLGAAILFRLATGKWWTAGHRSPELFGPTFAVSWLDTIPSAHTLLVVQLVGCVAAVVAVAGRRHGIALPVAWATYVLLTGIWSSAGKILHNDLLLILASIPLLFAASDARLHDRSASCRWGWPPRAALVIVAAIYFVTGLQKLRHGGLAWATSDNLRWVLYAGARTERSRLPELARHIADHPWLSYGVATATLLTELGAPLILGLRALRPWFVASVAVLHGGVWLTLGLDYSAWFLCVLVVALGGRNPTHRSPDVDASATSS